ncbi:MAG TPA: YfhO family protein, partial [Thermomicrobiaceae bacterium]|nr:YfhO family protein [Thermomicrobiaceae bacterium]
LLAHVVFFGCLLLWLLVIVAGILLRRRRPCLLREIVALSGLLLAELLFFWRPLLTTVQVPNGGGDFASFYFPLQAFSAQQIQQGHFPLWNPYLHAGMPQLANFQSGMLYPPNLITWLLVQPFSYPALELLVIAHYLIASLGAYLLARTLGLRRLPAVLSGVIFAYSGFLIAQLGHVTMLEAAAWLPLLFLTVRKLAVTRSWLWALATAIVVFLATTAGHQQTLLYELTASIIWWLFWTGEREGFWQAGLNRDWEASLRRIVRPFLGSLLRFVAALACGLMVAAPMVLPSLRLSQRSVRTLLSYEQSTEFSIEPIALLQFFLPKAFGSNPTDYWGPFSNGEVWGYAGIVTLLLVAIALAVRVSRLRVFLAGIAGVALFYALGPFTPLQGWVYRFAPLYDLVRAPARALLYVDLCLGLLAGIGLQELLERALLTDERIRQALRWAPKVLLIILAVLLLFVLPLYYTLVVGSANPLNRPMIVIDGIYLLILYLGLAAVLLWARGSGRLAGTSCALLMGGLVVLDLFGATASFNPAPSGSDLTAGFRHQQAVDFLRAQTAKGGLFRIDVDTASWQPNLAAIVGLDDIGGLYDPMQLKSYDQARSAVASNRTLPLYDLLAARYLVTDANAKSPGSSFHKVLQTDDGLTIWENPNALPRVWLAGDARQEQVSVSAAQSSILSPSFDPRHTLYLSGNAGQPATGTGSAAITEDDPDVVRIQVKANGNAELVLADVAYPGWRAYVDGKPTSIATADGLFRVVTIPAGSHDVVFRFEPPLFRVGLAVALAGIVLGFFMLGLGLFQRRHPGSISIAQ